MNPHGKRGEKVLLDTDSCRREGWPFGWPFHLANLWWVRRAVCSSKCSNTPGPLPRDRLKRLSSLCLHSFSRSSSLLYGISGAISRLRMHSQWHFSGQNCAPPPPPFFFFSFFFFFLDVCVCSSQQNCCLWLGQWSGLTWFISLDCLFWLQGCFCRCFFLDYCCTWSSSVFCWAGLVWISWCCFVVVRITAFHMTHWKKKKWRFCVAMNIDKLHFNHQSFCIFIHPSWVVIEGHGSWSSMIVQRDSFALQSQRRCTAGEHVILMTATAILHQLVPSN